MRETISNFLIFLALFFPLSRYDDEAHLDAGKGRKLAELLYEKLSTLENSYGMQVRTSSKCEKTMSKPNTMIEEAADRLAIRGLIDA